MFTLVSASALALAVASTGMMGASAGASPSTPGVTAKTITIGASVPLSGVAASYADVSASANAVFKYIDKKGGVNGRQIKYIRLDDCYGLAAYGLGCTAGASTTPLSVNQQLVAQDHVFATVGSLGTAAEMSVMSYLKQNAVPQLFVASGSISWNQPKAFPDVTGFEPSYVVEGKIFARYIKQHYSTDTIGFIGQNDDLGAYGLLGVQDGGITIPSADNLTYNAADAITGSTSDLVADVSALAANMVPVVVVFAVPGFTAGILAIAHQLGYSPQWIISSVGSNPLTVNTPLEANAVTVNYFPNVNDNADPWIPWLRKVLLSDPTDFPNFTSKSVISYDTLYGASYALAFAETLKAEGKNVTRAGFLKKLFSTKLDTPSITPLKYTAGNHQGLQGASISIVTPNGTSAPIYSTNQGGVFTSTQSASSGLTGAATVIDPIPAWLK